jgi:hypothetical protein
VLSTDSRHIAPFGARSSTALYAGSVVLFALREIASAICDSR